MGSSLRWGLVLVAVVTLLELRLVTCNSEVDALIALKHGLNDPAGVLQSWDPTPVNPCTWFHVTCDGDNLVTRVDLASANLSGVLAAELGSLQHLQYLNLSMNNISGVIPAELGNLTSLVSLDLHTNKFTGEIPIALGNLKSLRYLHLDDNLLTGGIPCKLSSIPSLKAVHVSFV